MRSLRPHSFRIIFGFSLALALALAADWWPFLRGGYGWQWPYEPVDAARLLPLILAVAVYLSGGWFLLRKTARPAPVLGWSLVGSAVLPLVVATLRSNDVLYELFARTISGVTTGPHLAAATIDWSAGEWRDWLSVMERATDYSRHVALGPPGLPLWYGMLNGLLAAVPALAERLRGGLLPYQCHNYRVLAYTAAEWASAWFGMMMPVWAAFTVFPLYGAARRLVGDRARWTVTWWPLVPALLMFAPTWNTLFPLLSVTAFWMLLVGLARGSRPRWAVGSGFVTGLLTFASFSAAPLLGLLGAYVVLHELAEARYNLQAVFSWRLLRMAGFFAIGLALPWIGYGAASGQTPFDMLSMAMSRHLELDRPYLPWLWLHFWEWVLMTGMPLVVLWLLSAFRQLRHYRRREGLLSLSLLLTMAALVLSGTARGETGRVWLFFSPLVLIAAVDGVNALAPGDAPDAVSWRAVTVAQAFLAVALAFGWNVIEAPDVTPPPPPPGGLMAARPADAIFGGVFRLAAWEATVDHGEVTLRLDWQGLERVTRPYYFSALLVAPDGVPLARAVDWQPLATRYPTTCWSPGEWVGDTVRLPLPPDAMPGDWWISLSSFPDVTRPEERVTVTMPDGSVDSQVGLGPVPVP